MDSENNEIEKELDILLNNNTIDDKDSYQLRHLAKKIYGKMEQKDFVPEKKLVINNVNKNSRKSRNGKGRGLPKKGGAGGKGTWGKLGEEVNEVCIDKNDPNYDSESSDDVVAEITIPELKADELNLKVEPVLQEYFNHGKTQEVLDALTELNIPSDLRPGVAVLAITLALDRRENSDRELVSILLSEFSHHNVHGHRRIKSSDAAAAPADNSISPALGGGEGKSETPAAPFQNGGGRSYRLARVLSNQTNHYHNPNTTGEVEFTLTHTHFERAFYQILSDLNDDAFDIPAAPEMIGNFMARAVADDCFDANAIDALERKFVALNENEDKEHSFNDRVRCAINRARKLLKYPNSNANIGIESLPSGTKETLVNGDISSTLPSFGDYYCLRKRQRRPMDSLLRVWGVTGSVLPTKTLRKTVDSLLHEFLQSIDRTDSSSSIESAGNNGIVKNVENAYEAASRSLKALCVPHFNHEYVFRALLLAIEDGTKVTASKLCQLLTYMVDVDGVLDSSAIEMGFERVIETLPELMIVMPDAQGLFEKFVEMCCEIPFAKEPNQQQQTNSSPKDIAVFDEQLLPNNHASGDHVTFSSVSKQRANNDGGLDNNVGGGGPNGDYFPVTLAPTVSGELKEGGITCNGIPEVATATGRKRYISHGTNSLASILATKDFSTKLQNKGRKRFVSEGDGGLLKETPTSGCDFK